MAETNNNIDAPAKEATREIRHFAGRFARPGVEADDLAQEAELAFFRLKSRFDPERGARLRTYAWHRIVGAIPEADLALFPIKTTSRYAKQLRMSACCARIGAPELREEIVARFKTLIEALPLPQRTALAMRYIQGRSFAEIGEVLGLDRVGAWKLHDAALQALKHGVFYSSAA